MARRQEKKVPTRKHRARADKEKMFNRYIVISAVVVFAAVAIIVGFGVVQEFIIIPKKIVAEVNGTQITAGDFQTRVRYERLLLVNNYTNMLLLIQQFGGSEEIQAFYVNEMRKLEFQLDPTTIGNTVLNTMIEDELIRQQAQELGITVTQEEIEDRLQNNFGYFPLGTPTQAPTTTVLPTSTFSETQLALVTYTPTITETPLVSPTATQDLTSTADLTSVPTEIPTEIPTEAPTEGPAGPTLTHTPQPSPTEYTFEAYEDVLQEYLKNVRTELRFSEEDLRTIIEMELYREKMNDHITLEESPMQDMIWVRHIVVADQETAQEVLDRYNNGEDWAALAAEYSTDEASKETGGDLGWITVTAKSPDFISVAFNTPVGNISEPTLTPEGWHIIQILGHEEKQLEDSEFQQLKAETFSGWLAEVRATSETSIADFWPDVVPTNPAIPDQYRVDNLFGR